MNRKNESTRRVRLTKKVVDAARASHDGKRRVRVWDTDVPQLYLQITPKGSASYCIRYVRPDGGKNDFTLIQADFAPPDRAREAAVLAIAKLKLEGIEPSVAKRTERAQAIAAKIDTFAALAAKFDELHPELSDSDRGGRRNYLARYILPKIGKKHFKEVTTSEVRQLVRDVQQTIVNSDRAQAQGWTGQDGANLCQFIIRRIYNFAIEEKWATENPAAFDQIFPNNREKRFEKFDEASFAVMWGVNYDRVVSGRERINASLATLIYLATLQRPIDVARSRRQDVDLDKALWIVPQWMTKKKLKPYYIPLSPLSCQLFRIALGRHDSPFTFPSIGGHEHIARTSLSQRFCDDVGTLHGDGVLSSDDLQLYDGRRFGRTQIEYEMGYGERVAELVINHYDENNPSRIYNVHDYRKDVRQAQNDWGAEIQRMVGGQFEGLYDGSVHGTPGSASLEVKSPPEVRMKKKTVENICRAGTQRDRVCIAALNMLRRVGRPLHLKELLSQFDDTLLESGQPPHVYLSNVLSRDMRFISTRRGWAPTAEIDTEDAQAA